MLEMLAGIALVVVIGGGIELLRRGKLRTWVEQQDGSFSPSGAVPEGAAFDSPEHTSYRNIARFQRRGVDYVVAERLYVRHGATGSSSSSQVVCYARIPGQALPPVVLMAPLPAPPPALVQGVRSAMGVPDRPPAIPLDETVEGFAAAFEVRARDHGAVPDPAAVAAVLDRPLQQALLAHRSELSSVALDGEIVRVQAASQQLKRNHAQALAAAEAVVGALRVR